MVTTFTKHVYEHDSLACDKTPYLEIYNYLGGFNQFQGDQGEIIKEQG